MAASEKLYRVEFAIDVVAETPAEACQTAWGLLTNPDALLPVGDVTTLTDGEDFELLFTVAGADAVKLLDAWKKQFPKLKLSCIGKITAGEGVTIRDQTGTQPLTAHGSVHFA